MFFLSPRNLKEQLQTNTTEEASTRSLCFKPIQALTGWLPFFIYDYDYVSKKI